jgi:hypothetical protein
MPALDKKLTHRLRSIVTLAAAASIGVTNISDAWARGPESAARHQSHNGHGGGGKASPSPQASGFRGGSGNVGGIGDAQPNQSFPRHDRGGAAAPHVPSQGTPIDAPIARRGDHRGTPTPRPTAATTIINNNTTNITQIRTGYHPPGRYDWAPNGYWQGGWVGVSVSVSAGAGVRFGGGYNGYVGFPGSYGPPPGYRPPYPSYPASYGYQWAVQEICRPLIDVNGYAVRDGYNRVVKSCGPEWVEVPVRPPYVQYPAVTATIIFRR